MTAKQEPNKPLYFLLSVVFIAAIPTLMWLVARFVEPLLGTGRWVSPELHAISVKVGLVLLPIAFLFWASMWIILISRGRGIPLEGTSGPVFDGGTKFLVQSGPYRHVRNPMYVSYLTCAVAVGFLSSSPFYLLVLVPLLFWWSNRFVVRYEEVALDKRFGASYFEYKRNVPRWIPRLTPYRGQPGSH